MSRKKHKQKKDRERREKVRRELLEAREARRRGGSRPDTRRRPVRRPAAGAPAPRPPVTEQSRFLQERAERWMLWARRSRGVPNGEAIADLVRSGDLEGYKDDPAEAAQEYAYQALEAADREQAHALALQAYHLDDRCADARRVLADIDASSHLDRVGLLKKALMDEEGKHAEVMQEFEGRLSDAVELRPYLRTRLDLAVALWAADRKKRGSEHLEVLFSQDKDDLVGARYPLIMARLHAGDFDGAGVLIDDPETEQAELLVRWARVLQKVLAGDDQGARSLYAELSAGREGEAASLANPPPEDFAYPGFFRDEIYEYAALCLRMLHWAWHARPETTRWLEERAAGAAA